MKELQENSLKLMLVDELKVIDEFCDKNNLTYFILYGTLLGAVRHKGFIPWDDDIDIVMPRKDYEVFVKTFNNFNKNYSVIDSFSSKKYYLPFAKVIDNNTILIENINVKFDIGLYIDIFPLDNIPDDVLKRKQLFKKIDKYNKLRNCKYMLFGKNVLKNVAKALVKIILLPISANYISRMTERLSQKYNNIETNDVGVVIGLKNSTFKKELFHSSCKLEFEGYLFNAPMKYDEILKISYGNYMELPPIEKRVTHHSFKVYIK